MEQVTKCHFSVKHGDHIKKRVDLKDKNVMTRHFVIIRRFRNRITLPTF